MRIYVYIIFVALIVSGCVLDDDKPIVPSPPVLSVPLNNSVDVSITPTFSWGWGDVSGISAVIEVSTDSLFTDDSIVLRKEQYGFILNTKVQSPAMSFQDSTKYYWRVCAFNTNGYSNWSDIWNFTTNY